jgi:hypothetical protein
VVLGRQHQAEPGLRQPPPILAIPTPLCTDPCCRRASPDKCVRAYGTSTRCERVACPPIGTTAAARSLLGWASLQTIQLNAVPRDRDVGHLTVLIGELPWVGDLAAARLRHGGLQLGGIAGPGTHGPAAPVDGQSPDHPVEPGCQVAPVPLHAGFGMASQKYREGEAVLSLNEALAGVTQVCP